MIEISKLSHSYGGEKVLENVSLLLPPGKRIALMGPSGCGKTTLLRGIAGLITPVSGEIRVSGKISYVFQEPRLFPWLTAEQNVSIVSKKISTSKSRHLLSALELSECSEKYPDELSGGQRQRVSIARALSVPFDILLLDEPFRGLDEGLRRRVFRLISQHAEGKILIIATHDPAEAEALGAEIYEYSQKRFLPRE